MFMSRTRTAWAGAGLLLTIITASPVWADDVELLLSTPASSNAAKPNILFIIDSSGSMNTIETSQEPYLAGTPYSGGGCDDSYYYWTTGNNVPNCGSSYRIRKTAFLCQQGITQLGAAGSYKDTMAMYRPNNKGKWKWRTLDKNRENNAVECEADSGVHGYGSNPADEPYAQAGTNIDPYTADSTREVDWGVKPTHKIVTMYDSDYLSWYHNPPGSSMSRTNIVKAVTKNVLGSVKDVNVGFMQFNWDQGGTVIHGIKDLDSNRTAADTVVDGIPAAGWTPLSETMYEAALYWRGMDGVYADVGDTDKAAADAWDEDAPAWVDYKQPAEYSCSKNFVVLLTDGAPTQDTGAFADIPLLPSFGRASCNSIDGDIDSNVNGACLDDVAEYLNRVDINPALAGKQEVVTYTIGFSVDLPILRDTAKRGGGEYYLASDVKSLTAVLTEIVTDIFDEDISFTAPAVAVNAFNRTQHLNDLYVSVFRAEDRARWPGNLKKYKIQDTTIQDAKGNNAIDPDSGFFDDDSKNFWNGSTTDDGANVFEGGTANILPDPSIRKLFTNNGTGNLTVPTNHLSVGNESAYTDADFGLTGAAGEPTKAQLIEWMRGVDVKDEDGIAATLTRDAMGDTLHSQPAAVVYGKPGNLYDVVIYNGTNDGYLHAINAETGVEKWSFVPRELLVNMAELYENDNVDYKNYGIDGDIVPVVHDANGDGIIAGSDFVYLLFGMRRGGDNYYAIDVSNPDLPILKWIKTYPEFGQSWSPPVVAKIDIDVGAQTSAQKAVVVLGGGYDTSHDAPAHPNNADLEGAGVYMLDLETGDMLWRAGRDSFANLERTQMTRSIPGRIRVIDLNGDGLADRMYAADLGGQIWRFDITNGNKPDFLVAGGVIARVGAEGMTSPTAADTRRLYTTPDVAMFVDKRQDRRYLAINIGTGYRAHPLDNSASDRFYSIRDPHIFNALTQGQYNSYDIIEDGDLIDVSGTVGTVIPANGDGWKFVLPDNQKILSDSQTFDNSVYFVSFEPRINSDDPCQAGLAANRLYRVNVVNGDPDPNGGFSVPPTTPEEADEARVTKLEQGGIAPKPTFFFPSPTNPSCSGEECSPPPVGCVGVECFDPGFANFPVRTLWTQDGIE